MEFEDFTCQRNPGAARTYFGLVLSFGVFCWITRRKPDLFTVLAVTTVGWILAHQAAYQMYEFIDGELVKSKNKSRPTVPPLGLPRLPIKYRMSWQCVEQLEA